VYTKYIFGIIVGIREK